MTHATLVVDENGLITAGYIDLDPSPVGLTPEAWFVAEIAAGRDWRVDSDRVVSAGNCYLARVLTISRPS